MVPLTCNKANRIIQKKPTTIYGLCVFCWKRIGSVNLIMFCSHHPFIVQVMSFVITLLPVVRRGVRKPPMSHDKHADTRKGYSLCHKCAHKCVSASLVNVRPHGSDHSHLSHHCVCAVLWVNRFPPTTTSSSSSGPRVLCGKLPRVLYRRLNRHKHQVRNMHIMTIL